MGLRRNCSREPGCRGLGELGSGILSHDWGGLSSLIESRKDRKQKKDGGKKNGKGKRFALSRTGLFPALSGLSALYT